MSELEKVRQYLKDQEKSYTEFLSSIRRECNAIASELGNHVVLRVYDRTDKQEGSALKDAIKIFNAAPKPIKSSQLKRISDIVGVTVVVQYPDQIQIVLDRLKRSLKTIATEDKRKVHSEAYFATHAIYKATSVTLGGILCEVQCKTVLHDAWSAKMHDLTYKPLGSMDPRMKGLIEAISQSLEGLERQSQIARDMILNRQAGERKPLQASLAAFLGSVEGGLLKCFVGEDAPNDSLADLRSEVKTFVESADFKEEQAQDLGARIQAVLEDDMTAGSGWLVAVRFASALPDRSGQRFLVNAADTLFDGLQSLRERDLITESELRAIPIGFYALQDFDRALEYNDKLIANYINFNLDIDCINILKFNKATWILERESIRPSKPAARKAIRDEVEGLLSEVRDALIREDESVVTDTDGLMLIVFGKNKEAVRNGIAMCMSAGQPIAGDALATAVALSYAEWRNQVGWRRFFELDEEAS